MLRSMLRSMLNRLLTVTALLIGLAFAAAAEEETFVTFKVLTLETALELAEATLGDCRQRGFQVAVSVVDRFGNVQVTLRDRFAGPHTPETARRKAWTAVSFGTDTLTLSELTQPGRPEFGIRSVAEAIMLPGGVPVRAAGSIVAGIGVSGASPEMDDACARAGIEAITDKLNF